MVILRCRKCEKLAQGHRARKWYSQDLNTDRLGPELMVLLTLLKCLSQKRNEIKVFHPE